VSPLLKCNYLAIAESSCCRWIMVVHDPYSDNTEDHAE
jgi:hypothetical protein